VAGRALRAHKTRSMTVLAAKQAVKQRREDRRKPLVTRTKPIDLSQ